ncbi:P-loop containing nucleoside triphosphate hydrolase protein [Daldinia caldariorum]|uniref:P-loop containing nucleoside triphosphate hydrolase protein n=1 Tax=Daldinia caldariorum TaxID=326644 RepID=UPI0020086046|nr:P-loop containing nucleoside triphosphate hydrolase protein [Daldinia caldariorum]KAI1465295.1 P-loop containing nucleoside triphosphate hydrolase protein [Daldinia caldariorum]
MDDSSSMASFEEIGSCHRALGLGEDKNTEKLKTLVAKSAANGTTATDVAEDEVSDICYVLQYKGFGGKLVTLHRSREPINIELDEVEEGGFSREKPILEVVTRVSISVKKNRSQLGHLPYPRRHQWDPVYDFSVNNEYSHHHTRKQEHDKNPGMNIVQVEKKSMVIHSVHLINALRAMLGYYPDTSLLGDTVTINAPYHILARHQVALARYRTNQPNIHDEEYALTTAKHIDVLLNFLEETLGAQTREEEKRHDNKIPTATFDNLWLILKPGDIIYAKYDDQWTPFMISSVVDGSSADDNRTPYIINCWNISYISGRFCRTMHSFDIDPFNGEEIIKNLAVIPYRFFQGENSDVTPLEAMAKQVLLGKRTWELSKGPNHMFYNGPLVEKKSDFDRDYPGATGHLEGRVIVDGVGFSHYSFDHPERNNIRSRARSPPPNRTPPRKDQLPYFAPRCTCSACTKADLKETLSLFVAFQDLDPTRDSAPEVDLYYVLLSKIVSGFILRDRRWGHFNVKHLQYVEFDKEAFKYLVLDDEVKLTVRSLIGRFANTHGQVSPWPNDFVKNKGQGRIFLLHGPPGVGKTCTAECVAELTCRPLLSLTSGDLNIDSYNVERSLEYFLKLGERYGAVVLIDEADVYLEARHMLDISRNKLVSVFLRALEYHRGILFLTTNRVQTFDSAFTSCIHVALHYKSLTDADREKIWLNSFERLERDSGGKVYISVATREYAYESHDVKSLRWNGREIRNALQTAVALAETEAVEDDRDKVTVTDKHLRAVVKMSRGFKSFLSQQKKRTNDDVEKDDEEEIEDN